MQKYSTPLWETFVLAGSFVLLWGWFLAKQAADHAHLPLAAPWHLALGAALLALIFVTVRRFRRVQRALRGEDESGNVTPPYPTFTTPPNDNHRARR